MPTASAPCAAEFVEFLPIQTRWRDNDLYGHVNNVVYYEYFDTAVNRWLIQQGLLCPQTSALIGVVVYTQCEYFESVAFPDQLLAGIKVLHLGNSSVRYQIGLFRVEPSTAGIESESGFDQVQSDQQASALGEFVHVYVDRTTRKPVPLPDAWREALVGLQRPC